MIKAVLFDWGDTLMEDLPGMQGPMCDWPEVVPVAGAAELLTALQGKLAIYLATNAADSSELQIIKAFERVGLAECFNGFWCRENLGLTKADADYFPEIARRLTLEPAEILMVGDSYSRDILPAQQAGLQALWFNRQAEQPRATDAIKKLEELLPWLQQQGAV